jgi:hypothetical protein
MRHSTITAVLFGSLLLGGCDPTGSDDLALALDPVAYPAPDSLSAQAIEIRIDGVSGGDIKLPACPVDAPIEKLPVINLERLEGDSWALKQEYGGGCDPETATASMTMSGSLPSHFRVIGPRDPGSYRWTLWVETPDGDRKAIHSPEMTVTGG